MVKNCSGHKGVRADALNSDEHPSEWHYDTHSSPPWNQGS